MPRTGATGMTPPLPLHPLPPLARSQARRALQCDETHAGCHGRELRRASRDEKVPRFWSGTSLSPQVRWRAGYGSLPVQQEERDRGPSCCRLGWPLRQGDMAEQSALPGGVVHDLPEDFQAALTLDAGAVSTWLDITPLARNEWICWIESAKKPETRRKRIAWGCSNLHDGKRRPCCWPGCPHRHSGAEEA